MSFAFANLESQRFNYGHPLMVLIIRKQWSRGYNRLGSENLGMSKNKHETVSLFSGAMGLDLGLESVGFKSVVCNEIDSAAVNTIKLNRPRLPVSSECITEISKSSLEKLAGTKLANVPLLAGGPPCQAFSVYGKREGTDDGRGQLVFEYLRLVDEIKPKCFVMENVRGLHSMSIVPKKNATASTADYKTEKGSLLKEIIKRFEAIGYRLDCFLVNSVNYGSPQLRERLICVGNKFDLVAEFPNPVFSNRREDSLPPFKTLGDAIGSGFDDPDSECMNFSPRKLKYLEMVPAGGNWRSLPVDIQKESMGKAWYLKGGRSAYWRKLSFEFPSPTIVTMPNHAGTSMCHPVELRALTVGECAAIQEFPKDWKFSGSTTEKCRQIGNAVPVRLGAMAGKCVLELLGQIDSKSMKRRRKPTIASRIVHLRPHVRTKSYWKNGKAFSGNESYYSDEKGNNQLPLFR